MAEAKVYKEMQSGLVTLNERAKQIDEWRKFPEKYKPVSTGIPELDKLIIGLPQAIPFIMLLVAEEKKGKTTVAQHLHRAWADGTGEKVAYYLLEELSFQWADRWISSKTTLDRNQIVKLEINDEQMQEIYDEIAMNTDELERYILQDDIFILADILKECKLKGITKLVIDNMTFTDTSGLQGTSREKFEILATVLMKARNKDGMSIIAVSHDATGAGKAFGSGHMNRAGDIIVGIEDAYTNVDDEKVKLPDVRALHVHDSRLAPEGWAYIGFDGAKSTVYPRKQIDIASDEFLTLVQQDTKKAKKKATAKKSTKAKDGKLPNKVELDGGTAIQFDELGD